MSLLAKAFSYSYKNWTPDFSEYCVVTDSVLLSIGGKEIPLTFQLYEGKISDNVLL